MHSILKFYILHSTFKILHLQVFNSVKYFRILIIVLLHVAFVSCERNYVSSIPNYPVGMRINLTTDYPNFKNSTGQILTFTERKLDIDRLGFGGILLCTGLMTDDFGNSLYYAYDMACPYEADLKVRVYPMEEGLGRVKCEKCGTEYNVGYGFGDPDTQTGPSTEILKRYRVTISSDYLTVLPK